MVGGQVRKGPVDCGSRFKALLGGVHRGGGGAARPPPPRPALRRVARTVTYRFLWICTVFVDFLPLTLPAVQVCRVWLLPPLHDGFNHVWEHLLRNTTMDQVLIVWQAVDSRAQVFQFIREPKAALGTAPGTARGD